ncbi:transmembrane protein 230 [Anabrus simplex]|uniref:transmembrane protein 230 n=1 Tax=Anabrus simplex TaxID=316456 RepID=UPI0034DCE43D
MSRRRVTTFNNINYQKLSNEDRESRDSEFTDAQFESPPSEIPWKALILAFLLCVGGTVLLVMGSLLVSGYFGVKYSDRTWPLIIMGMIMFLPGAYHVRIAYCAYRQYPGYSFDDIPEFS